MEALVASVIFLTVFLIGMHSLTNIARINRSGPSPVEMEQAVRECRNLFENESINQKVYQYDWGTVEFKADPYRMFDDLYDVTVVAKTKSGNTVVYRYLLTDARI